MGGGTEINYPEQASSGDAIKQWVKNLPTIYETQMHYAPLEAAQQIDIAQRYAQPYGEAIKQAQSALYPETTALQEQMAGQASEGMNAGLEPWEEEYYRDMFASNLGTNVGSGIGADYMSRGMLQAQQNRRDYYRNLGLSLAGRQPLSQPMTPNYSNYMGSYSPATELGYNASTYGSRVGSAVTTQEPNYLGMGLMGAGSIFSGLGAMGWGQG